MNDCLLDTSAALDLMRGQRSVRAASQGYSTWLVSFAVWGELMTGVFKSRDPAAEMARLETWVTPAQIIEADQETASIYGELIADLEKRGRRIPTNDIWIAATAIQLDLPLVARDGHFGRIAQLRWVAY